MISTTSSLEEILTAKQQLSVVDRAWYRFCHRYARKSFERFMRQKLGSDFRSIDPGCAAPPELILTTGALDEKALVHECHPDVYFLGGYGLLTNWLQILDHFSFNLRTMGAVLDFGCGTARMLRHFRGVNGLRIVGCDVSTEMIHWCRETLPEIEFYQNQMRPPLTFAEDNSFDLVCASGVFVIIPLELQKPWLEEICRILRPGGMFLCNVVGSSHPHLQLLSPEERTQLDRTGHLTLTGDNPHASLYARITGTGIDVLQSRSRLIALYRSVFNLVDYIPGGLDTLVLEKPNPSAIAVHRPFPGVGVGFAR